MDPTQTSEDFVPYNLDSCIKGYHVYQEVCSPELLEEQNAVPEPSNVIDKYMVCVQRDGEVVGHLMKGKSGRFAKTIFYFLRADKKNDCTVVVTGKAINRGDREGMQMPCTLHFNGAKRFIDIVNGLNPGVSHYTNYRFIDILKNELRRNIL